MLIHPLIRIWPRAVVWILWACAPLWPLALQAADPAPSSTDYLVIEMEGTVEFKPKGTDRWYRASTNQVLYAGDELRTSDFSRAVIRWSDLTTERLGERSRIRIPDAQQESSIIEFFRGIKYFFHRDKPGEFDLRTPRVSAVVRGTEFSIEVEEDGTTLLTLFDGQVDMTNEFGSLHLSSGQEAIVRPGQPPQRTAMIASINRIQWCLYYPAVLHLDELEMTNEERTLLKDSLAAYRQGDLLHALNRYPADRQPTSESETIYRAALLLSVGQVNSVQALLDGLPRTDATSAPSRTTRLADALRQLIAAVTQQPFTHSHPPVLASEWLAHSYYLQSQSRLKEARQTGGHALEVAPEFGFGLARAAELAFSFGDIQHAQALNLQSLQHVPRHAQAMALQGFLLSAQNRIDDALQWFEQAIATDGALGNAWLGRGLCRIRQGQTAQGLDDLQVAATLEPQRALLRSYLAKAYSNANDNPHATQEIELAKELDPSDPTAWLYAALIKQQGNRINEAIADLEKAQDLNDNRGLYRSQLLLDQDRAVRSANLANLYADAGMDEVSVREAARSVNADYANFSGHLFLANSYSRLQDPGRVNLRYETAAVSEYLVANLLAPVGAGALSPTVSQQEYSKLFEGEGFGLVSSTEYLSRGAWNQDSALYGTFGNTSFSLDSHYLTDNGQQSNNDLEQTILSLSVKQQITPADQLFGQVLWSESEGGDLAPYYDPEAAWFRGGPNPSLKIVEKQEPIVLAGYQHQWAPGSHTLFLASRLNDSLDVDNPYQSTLLLDKTTGSLAGARAITLDQDYDSDLDIYSAELQQIFENGRQTWIVGGRYQYGEYDTSNQHTPTAGSGQPGNFFTNLVEDIDADLERASAYAYYQWQIADPLKIIAGVSYDYLQYPSNFRYAPLANDEDSTDQISPKAGFIWTPTSSTSLRAAYSRSLGGVSFDQSFRLEPSQVAGINQAYRSVIPDAVSGANAAEEYDVYGVVFDQRFPTRTYLGIVADWLVSDSDRDIGVYDALPPTPGVFPIPPFIFPSTTRQDLDYEEQRIGLTLHQLLADEWAVGATYQWSHADLDIRFKNIPASASTTGFESNQDLEAYLHQVRLFGVFNHPCGFFAKAESLWFQQSNQGYSTDIPGDDFWQFNLFGGYRFFQRKAEVTMGVLNIADQDYRLNPLNVTASLPRDRTFVARFRFNY